MREVEKKWIVFVGIVLKGAQVVNFDFSEMLLSFGSVILSPFFGIE